MTSRERMLAFVICALMAVVGLFYMGGQVKRSFSKRAGQKRQLQELINQKEKRIESARRATVKLKEYEDMSLPTNVESAKSQYQSWLSELLLSADFEEPRVKPISTRDMGNSKIMRLNVSGKANLEQLGRFLKEFYSVNALHRIDQMPIKPQRDSRQLSITMYVEARMLDGALKDRDFSSYPLTEIGNQSTEKVIDPIVQRNMFSKANNPPQLASVGRKSIELGKTLEVKLSASDNEKDNLEYSLIDGPDGVRLNAESGAISWKPDSVGNFELRVAVKDDGIPSKSSEEAFLVAVNEPPPPPKVVPVEESTADVKLKFDDAKFTYGIATVEVNDISQVWLRVRTSGAILKVSTGEVVEVGSVQATVGKIGPREFELIVDGHPQTLKLNEPITSVVTES